MSGRENEAAWKSGNEPKLRFRDENPAKFFYFSSREKTMTNGTDYWKRHTVMAGKIRLAGWNCSDTLLNGARSIAHLTNQMKPIKWRGFYKQSSKLSQPKKISKMNFRFALILAQLGATYARRFYKVPRKWTIKALEPKFVPADFEQNRNARLWLNSHMIRY